MKTSLLLRYLDENEIPYKISPFEIDGQYMSRAISEEISFDGNNGFLQELVEKAGKPIYDTAVFIGRFQPIHNEHLKTIKLGLKIAKELVVVLGSAKRPRDPRNPWKDEEREGMIRACLTLEENKKTHFLPVADYWYNNPLWFVKVQEGVARLVGKDKTTSLIGYEKDASTWYLSGFPQWDFLPFHSESKLSATEVRETLFGLEVPFKKEPGLIFDIIFAPANNWAKTYEQLPIPKGARDYIQQWALMNSDAATSIIQEAGFLAHYKEKWKAAPFQPTFVTVDCVVIKSTHILLVRRGHNPGKRLLALPGGFLNQTEEIEDAALRELKEETKIKVSEDELRSSIEKVKVFANPQRDLRGRTITHAHLIDLGFGSLPSVKGGDDAAEALWLPLAEIHDRVEEFFGDHYGIITNLVHC